MSARAQIKSYFEEHLEGVVVIADVRELAELDPAYSWAIQLVRTTIAPAPRIVEFLETFEVWIIDPDKAPDTVEDKLDEHVDEFVQLLLGLKWLTWESGTREPHPDEHHAYKFTITAGTQREE